MDSNLSTVPISNQELSQFSERASRLLLSVKWTAKPWNTGAVGSPPAGSVAWRDSAVETPLQEELSLLAVAKQIGKDPLLLPQGMNHALTVVRQALCIGMHLSKAYTKFSGLDQLVLLNSKGSLSELQKLEFRNKYQTASIVAVFSTSYYLLWELSQYKPEELSSIQLDMGTLPEIFLQDPVRSLECFLFYFGSFVQKSGQVKSEAEFLKAALLFAERNIEEIQRRLESVQYPEPFTNQVYQLENSEFLVRGFQVELSGRFQSIDFNRVSLDEIVGNREAKHLAKRLAGRLLCYDPKTKKNPMQELGGLSAVTMGYGEPGTGKSLLISALATLLSDFCENLKIPFLFWPLPDTVVSTFQGGSAERMMTWMSALKDPTRIIYAPIDDAENNFEDRSRQGVSSGVREVIAVFLRNTEGAYALNRGNTLIQLFTNLPDQIDKAVLSRINERAYIGGASKREDFLDQDYLWYRKYSKISEKFVNQQVPKGYEYLSSQKALRSLSEISERQSKPKEARILAAFERTLSQAKTDSHDFYANLFAEVKKDFPFFTSRDVRNIQRAIDSRVLDFDFPDAWFEDASLFFKRNYEEKKSLLVEQMKSNMGTLSFSDIRLQETVRYLDTLVDIADSGRERRISSLLEDLELRTEAEVRFRQGGK